MGLFSKKRSSDAEQNQQKTSGPFVADDQTVARVAEIMERFNDAVGGSFDRLHAIGGNLCSVAGSGSFTQFVSMKIDAEEWFAQPWKMLAAVSLRATQNADHFLSARIFGFTSYWGAVIAPHIDRADVLDVPMLSCPPAIEAEIATLALGSLQRLSGDWVIFGNDMGAGDVTAGQLVLAAASVIVQAPEKGIPVDESVLAAARSIVG